MPGIVTAGVVLLAARPAGALPLPLPLPGRVTPERLAVSVGRDVPGLAIAPCRAAAGGGGRWTCAYMVNGSSSDIAAYAVQVHAGSSCWSGRLTQLPRGVAGWPKHVDGCVRRWQPW